MRRARLTVLAAVVLLLAGCAAIPSTGSVQTGSTEGPNDTRIVYLPNPPAPGSSQRDIVTGFLAAASAGRDFRVAKEYLASSFATRWKPRARVLVQEAQPAITPRSPNDLRLEVPISGQVDGAGVYTPSGGTKRLDFHLVQQNGQWRIDAADDGIVLGQSVFQNLYTPQALQFFDPTWTRLVPDLRWFPGVEGATRARSVVQALVAGPAGPIAGGIAVNALRGATVANVDSSGDVTTVVLSIAAGASPTADQLGRMQQQLIQSLRLPTQSALQLIVNGRVATQVKALVNQPTSLAASVVADGRFGTISATGAFTEDRTLGKQIVAARPTEVTVSTRQRLAAVLNSSGDVVAVTPTGARMLGRSVVDPTVVAPTLDQQGWVYFVPAGSPGALVAADPRGRTVDVAADLGGTSVTSIEASPDGTRMLVLVQSPTGPTAFVAGIERDADGTPTGLSPVHYAVDPGGSTGTGLDATWVDDRSVAVVTRADDNSIDRVQQQQLGGVSQSLGQLANATSIVGTSSQSNVRVRLENGDLWVWTSDVWRSEGTQPVDVSVLAVQR